MVFKPTVSDAPGLARQLTAAQGGKLRFTYSTAIKGFTADLPVQAEEALLNNPNVAYIELTCGSRRSTTRRPRPGAWTGSINTCCHSTAAMRMRLRAPASTPMSSTPAYTHVELGSRAFGAFTAIKDGNGTDDCHGHGTHVAGTVGAATHGVAKGVTLYSVQVLDCTGYGTWSQIIAGIDWVTKNRNTRGNGWRRSDRPNATDPQPQECEVGGRIAA